MKIKIPREIEVGGFTFIVKSNEDVTQDLLSCTLFGEYLRTARSIKIRHNLTQQEWLNTFIHELIHAIGDVYIGDALDEKVVNSLATGFHQIFKQLGIEFDWSELEDNIR